MSLFQSILISGGGGMLARALAEVLRRRGVEAAAVDRAALDITDEKRIDTLFEKHRPTLLFNCAAYTKVDLCEQNRELADAVNGRAVGSLAAAARRFETCLVHFSTDFVFDGRASRPYRTDDPVNPLSAYGRSKLLGEQLLQEHAPPRWLIIRTAWLYGRGGGSFPRTMVERGRAGQPLKVVNDQVGSPTWTADLAEATLDLLDRDARGIWHITNGGETSWFDFARATLEEFGVEAEIAPATSDEWARIRPGSAIRPAYSVLDIRPFAEKVGRPMRPWREALHDFGRSVEQSGGF